ncbi:uncharacterized protein LOC144344600 [Saccoglossus kowalevskii]
MKLVAFLCSDSRHQQTGVIESHQMQSRIDNIFTLYNVCLSFVTSTNMADESDYCNVDTKARLKDATGEIGTGVRIAEPLDNDSVLNTVVQQKLREAREKKLKAEKNDQ